MKGNEVGGDEKANISYMSSVSRCCDMYFTCISSSLLGINLMSSAGTDLGLWSQTQTR
jgi:hypothetical protein